MQVAFLENADSFTWNVVDRLPFPRERIRMVPGSRPAAVRAAIAEADAVVIGPGPRDPLRAGGLTEAVRLAAERGLPLLGICLGLQALGLAYGARLVRGAPTHGKTDAVRFSGARMFPGFEGPLRVMRYHSLSLTAVAAPLRVVATSEDGTVMAAEHETLPLAGVQFHPDSYASERGEELLAAFFAAARAERR